MKIEIKKTYSLWRIISALAGICVIIPMVYCAVKNDYQQATFYGVIYLAILIERLRDSVEYDYEEEESSENN